VVYRKDSEMMKSKKTGHCDGTLNDQKAAARGRPRDESATPQILKAALTLVLRDGFRAVSVDAIAAEAGVGKTTIYRRWPNKAAVVMDAFLADIGPQIPYPAAENAREQIRLQMRFLARLFNGRAGKLLRILLGEIQFDPELEVAFRERWVIPRRATARKMIVAGIRSGELAPYTDPDALMDALYAPIYYTLLIGNATLDDAFADARWATLFGER
jgi:AcrR family transcriptional regulator